MNTAKFFIDTRGPGGDEYTQSHKKVIDQDEAVGHAVRAGYMYSGMADVAALTGEQSYINAIDRLWENVVGKKLYITGGIGSDPSIEGFGPAYDLPNMSAYCESLCGNWQYVSGIRGFSFCTATQNISMCWSGRFTMRFYRAFHSMEYITFIPIRLHREASTSGKTGLSVRAARRTSQDLLPRCPVISMPTMTAVFILIYLWQAAQPQKSAAENIQISQDTDYPWDGTVIDNSKSRKADRF